VQLLQQGGILDFPHSLATKRRKNTLLDFRTEPRYHADLFSIETNVCNHWERVSSSETEAKEKVLRQGSATFNSVLAKAGKKTCQMIPYLHALQLAHQGSLDVAVLQTSCGPRAPFWSV